MSDSDRTIHAGFELGQGQTGSISVETVSRYPGDTFVHVRSGMATFCMMLTPGEARELARGLLDGADAHSEVVEWGAA